MNAKKNDIEKRLSVLLLAEKLENISEACRILGFSRTQFYEYKRRYRDEGKEGLKNRPPVHRSHPLKTPKRIENLIIKISLENPLWGCESIQQWLISQGIQISSPTIQRVLINFGLGSRYQRIGRLEELEINNRIKLSPEQLVAIGKVNPCFRFRDSALSHPGQLLVLDVNYKESHNYSKKFEMTFVIDAYSNFVFARIDQSRHKPSNIPRSLFKEAVFPKFQSWQIDIKNTFSIYKAKDLSKFFPPASATGPDYMFRYEKERFNCSSRRFKKIISREFFRPIFRNEKRYSIELLCKKLSEYIEFYNYHRPNEGFPNLLKSPNQRINDYIALAKDKSP